MGWRDGLCFSCLQRGWDTLKISSQKLITEKQAVAAEMFVVVRLFWLHQDDALGEKAWTHLNALINRALVPLKCSLTGAPQSFTSTDLIAPRHWGTGMQNNNKNRKSWCAWMMLDSFSAEWTLWQHIHKAFMWSDELTSQTTKQENVEEFSYCNYPKSLWRIHYSCQLNLFNASLLVF